MIIPITGIYGGGQYLLSFKFEVPEHYFLLKTYTYCISYNSNLEVCKMFCGQNAVWVQKLNSLFCVFSVFSSVVVDWTNNCLSLFSQTQSELYFLCGELFLPNTNTLTHTL